MVLLKIPELLFKDWFWLAVFAIAMTIHYFFGKPPVPRKPSTFFLKHKQAVRKWTDILIIFTVALFWLIPIYWSVSMVLKPLLNPYYVHIPVMEDVKGAIAFFFMVAIFFSNSTSVFIGLLSTFQSNLTKIKRIILLVITLMPIIFTGLTLLSFPSQNAESFRLTIKYGLGFSFPGMMVNGPAIFAGQPFIRVVWLLGRKLKLVSGEYTDWG